MESTTCKKPYSVLSIVFFFSGVTLTFLWSISPMPVIYYLAAMVISGIIWGYVAFKYHIVDKALKNRCKCDVVLAIIVSVVFILANDHHINELSLPVITFSAFSLCLVFIYVLGRIRNSVIDFFRGLEKHERIFLAVGSTVFAVIIIILFNQTNVFYLPFRNGTYRYYDVIYSTDTGAIVDSNCYLYPGAPENDFRQPLFGIFAMPFALLATFVSYMIPLAYSYPLCLNITQNILLFITLLLLSRMLEVSKTTQIYFLLLSTVTFPFMLFALNMEQYIFAVFWTILLIYNNYTTRKTNLTLSVAATGSLLTSAILIPPLLILNKEFRGIVKKGLKMLLMFFAVFICGGMTYLIYDFNSFIMLKRFAAIHGFIEKFIQFTHFTGSCLIAPCSRIISDGDHILYRLCAMQTVNMAGIIVLGLSVLSGYLFRRKYIAQISIYWIAFAFVLICLFGWGTAENGVVLYSLYFFWAFIILFILLIDKLMCNTKYSRHIVFCVLFLALMVYNMIKMLDMINFGIAFYPVV